MAEREEERAETTPPARMTLADYAVINPDICASSIVRPPITADSFLIDPHYIHLIKQDQFSGAPHQDPTDHISNFLGMLDFFKIRGASEEAIRMRMFPLSLRDKAYNWIRNQPPGSLSSWDVLVKRFIEKFLPAGKQARTRQDVNSFVQEDGEPLHEAWERYNQLLKKCPTHAMPPWLQIRLFYDGLKMSNKGMIDAAAGGSLIKKTVEEAKDIIETMAYNSSQALSERSILKNSDIGSTQIQTILQQNKEMQQQIAQLAKNMGQAHITAAVNLVCDFCGGNHLNGECPSDVGKSSETIEEQAKYVGGNQRNNQFSNTYNPGYRNHPNFSWNSPALNPPQPQKQTWENAVEKLANSTSTFMEETRANFANQRASIRNLEVQVGQMAKQISERLPGTFPGDTITNPKERCNAITLRGGKSYEEPKMKSAEAESKKKEEVKKPDEKNTSEEPKKQDSPANQAKDQIPDIPLRVPFPQRLKKEEDKKQFSRFLEVFKKLQINIPFAEALEKMPAYAKFMKELLTKKRRIIEETVMLTQECSSIIQKKLPPKLKDPGSFNIPFNIGKDCSGKALCDLGASVNIMPLSMLESLGIGKEVLPTMAILQLADKSSLHPYGIVEDVLIKVNDLILPADFMILDIEEDEHVPLILGRPFLVTAGAVIDVPRGEVIFRVNGVQSTIKLFEKPPVTAEYFPPLMSIKHPSEEGGVDDDAKSKVPSLWGYLATP